MNIGFIGVGNMGAGMANNLLKAGYTLTLNDIRRDAAGPLLEKGARWAETPQQVAMQSELTFTSLPGPPDVEAVTLGAEGVLAGMKPGSVYIDLSSNSPTLVRQLHDIFRERGMYMLDAPVSGGDIGAINGTLSIMVGGSAPDFATVKPILDVMGNPEKVVHVGASGAGQLCKLCNQMVIGGTLVVVAEALALARKAGVDAAKVREALLGGFAQSRVLEVHGERALKGTFKPGFKTHLYAKDMRNVVSTLAEQNVPAPVTAVVQQLLHATMAAGHGEDDNSVMAKTVFELAGLE